eukprot:Skav229962  [mRNA]  locus=scaffold327:137699:145620:+ [translate_table: standard]
MALITRFKHSNGVKYVGQWRHSQAHGLGTYCDEEGITYSGEWMDDQPGGFGHVAAVLLRGHGLIMQPLSEARWTDSSKYAGNFLRGARHGAGEYTWPDGSKFTGQFQRNRIHGNGTWISSDGDRSP